MKKYFLAMLCAVIMLFVFTASAAAAEEAYDYANAVSGNVTVNGVSINTANAVYPFLLYKEITYFPMTYHLCRFLGVETNWTQETGLIVDRTGVFSDFVPDEGAVGSGGFVNITFPQYVIEINGKRIDNSKEEWPLITCNGITYFPLTWCFAVDEFGWEYSWTQETGLRINSGNPRDNSFENLLAILNKSTFSVGMRDYNGSLLDKASNELKPFEAKRANFFIVPPGNISPYGFQTQLGITPFVFITNASPGISVTYWGDGPHTNPTLASKAVMAVLSNVSPDDPLDHEFAMQESGYLLRCFLQMRFIGEERERIESTELLSRNGTVETWKLVAKMPDNAIMGTHDRIPCNEFFTTLVSDVVQITPVIDTATGMLLSLEIESRNYALKMVSVPATK